MIGGNSSSIFRSGSTEYPSHEDLIRGLLCKLVNDDKWEWVHFEAEDHRHCLEIADEEDLLLINLPFPFTKSLEETFRQASLTFPATWQLTAFRERGWWRAGYAELAAPHQDSERVVAFSVDVLQRLFCVTAREPIHGWLER